MYHCQDDIKFVSERGFAGTHVHFFIFVNKVSKCIFCPYAIMVLRLLATFKNMQRQ